MRIPSIFGIVNITEDSFSDGGTNLLPEKAFESAMKILEAGAFGVDLGAESSRPGSNGVPEKVERERLLPVIRLLKKEVPECIISVDTRKASVAEAALEEGADWINDISAMTYDPEMSRVIASHGAAVVLMHFRGTPATMQEERFLHYENVTSEVAQWLNQAFDRAVSCGIAPSKILLDPGLGFAKTPEQNWQLIRESGRLASLVKAPLYYGPSRKSYLKELCGENVPPSERDDLLGGVLCRLALTGIPFSRVHDVKKMMEILKGFSYSFL